MYKSGAIIELYSYNKCSLASIRIEIVEVGGPCKAPIKVQLQGTLQAPADPSGFKDGDGWVTFERIDGLTLAGGGIFDGQGQAVWGKHCKQTKYCSKLPIIQLRHQLLDSGCLAAKTSPFRVLVSLLRKIAPIKSDGIHVGHSMGIKITDTTIQAGDDCISLGDGSKKITVTKVTCGPGHGIISVGSLGKYQNEEAVGGVIVKNCTIKNTTNGN
ncbi:Glycoside hydrolase [Trema orientale]|uniref:Glycoside hydrolase n=1 Tax=Trema orientale TaxID=63057 RepID=A0A2P5DV16_TREOI|nr:Glycoside hydrolase [Trema orientale]